jgi:nucleoside phosphorylase
LLQTPIKLPYKEEKYSDIKHLNKGDIILLVTATDIETEITHQYLKPNSGYDSIIKIHEGNNTYYFGSFGNYKVVHVQCSMGSTSRNSSLSTVNEAIDLIGSKIVVMVGIAFGRNSEKQSIGDLLVSESIIPYNLKRVGSTTISRGIEVPASKILLNRFKNIKSTWEYLNADNKKAKLILTRILSGEELIDNKEHRDRLFEENPESKGGEMEGAGLSAACNDRANWILVKGICDFADGNKSLDKDKNQRIAMSSAISACLSVFSSKTAFKDLGVNPIEPKDETKRQAKKDNLVLFDVYDDSKSDYYVVRKEDGKFTRILEQFGVWVFGPTGCGKSNLIIRNTIHQKVQVIQISLASCIGYGVDSFFQDIFLEINSSVKKPKTIIGNYNFREHSRAIIEVLSDNFKNKSVLIYIEEIPINDQTVTEFAEKLFSLIISKALLPELDEVKFVLSSIHNPSSAIKTFQQKIVQKMKFLELSNWTKEDVHKLVSLLSKNLDITINDDAIEMIVMSSKGSPRFVKKFFRNIIVLGKWEMSDIKEMIAETERELFSI